MTCPARDLRLLGAGSLPRRGRGDHPGRRPRQRRERDDPRSRRAGARAGRPTTGWRSRPRWPGGAALLRRRDRGLRADRRRRCYSPPGCIVFDPPARRLPKPGLLVLPVPRRDLRRARLPRARLRADRDRRHRERTIGRESFPCSSSAPAPTMRCCSSPAIARSCAAPRTNTRRWPRRCGEPGPAIIASGLTVIAALLCLMLGRRRGHRRARPDRRDRASGWRWSRCSPRSPPSS